MFEQGLAARIMMGVGGLVACLYLVIVGLLLGMVANEDRLGGAVMLFVLPFALIADFLLRFLTQELPAMQLRPWLLLPVGRRKVVQAFLLADVCGGHNLVWLGLFLPFTVIIIIGGHGWVASLLLLLACQVMVMANGVVWTSVRTLMEEHILWVFSAVAAYGLLLLPMAGGFGVYGDLMEAIWQNHLALPLALLWTGAVAWAGSRLQVRAAMKEVQGGKAESEHAVGAKRLRYLERWGIVGEFLKLEIKMVLRCKMVRNQFVMSCCWTTLFTLLVAYSPLYQTEFDHNFWCFYCFLMYGLISLGKVMGAEGNYVSVLFTRKEHILQLLKAKYVFNSAMLLVPMLLCLPAVFSGSFSLLMVFSYMLLVCGPVYFCLFQLAVYNKEALPLNQSLTMNRKSNSGVQMGWGFAAMLVPAAIIILPYKIFSPQMAYLTAAAVGLGFILCSPLWLRSIYRRMMARKYQNLEGFYATR